MKVRTQLTTVLFSVISIGIVIAGIVFYTQLQTNARDEILGKARLMMGTAIAVRKFTVAEVRPNLDPVKVQKEFLPQSVPAFAATEVIKILQEKNPNFSYKEATLNPTNLRDKAEQWEEEIINDFRNNTDLKEATGEKITATGERVLWLARPITITNPNCLVCHSTPEAAPPSMIKKYGSDNGFGWKQGETVGAQVVTVPMTLPIKNANNALKFFLISLAIVFIVGIVILNITINKLVCKPLEYLSSLANSMSKGNLNIENKLKGGKNNEIASLSRSFERMRISISKTIAIIRKERGSKG